MSREKLLIIDGSSYLYRAFYASGGLTTSKGFPTGAIFGVTSMLKGLWNRNKANYVAVVFDPRGPTIRNDWYEHYKANRNAMPEDLVEQLDGIKCIIKALGFEIIELPYYEADDVIGTLAKYGEQNKLVVRIASPDKDMAQLVNKNITIFDEQKKTEWDEIGVNEKFGIPPSLIIDYLTLIGDASDNVPGVEKIGPKTAVKLLKKYGSLEKILLDSANISGKIGKNLEEAKSYINLSKKLVTIIIDVPFEIDLDKLKPKQQNVESLKMLYDKFELKTFLKEINDSDNTETEYETIFSLDSLHNCVKKIKRKKIFALDLETTSLDPNLAKIVGISLAWEEGKAVYIPLGHDYEGAPVQLNKSDVYKLILPILKNPNLQKIGHNLKYDHAVLMSNGVDLHGIAHDTMLQSYIINSTDNRHDLNTVAERVLGVVPTTYEKVTENLNEDEGFEKVKIDMATTYAGEDAELALRIHNRLFPKISGNKGLKSIYADIEVPLISVLSKMEMKGVLIDSEMLMQHSSKLKSKMVALEASAHKMAGQSFNLSSPKQIQEILFEKMKLPVITKTPKGQASTSESVLSDLSKDYELPKIILDYRSLAKLCSTYTDKLPKQVNIKTGRIHGSFHQAVTSTGRLSSSNPNLQNIPIRTEEGKKVREAFRAPPDKVLIAADYSQIELRIMAHISKDETLINAFKEEQDIHAATAAEVFETGLSNVSFDQRRAAKAINFGLIYGMSSFGLAKQLDITRNEAQDYIDIYFSRYPKIKQYMENIRKKAAKNGYVETIFGRRLYINNINSNQARLRQYAERTAINAPMQGSAADLIKLAMIEADNLINQFNFDASLILQVHDELVFEVNKSCCDNFSLHLKKCMEDIAILLVPLKVSMGIGDNWGSAH
ncbi:MAG: DNA polymerase I [Pseudomonadota bacterium]|nr:DNA polymerase I [Pseudomonadota bacterium]